MEFEGEAGEAEWAGEASASPQQRSARERIDTYIEQICSSAAAALPHVQAVQQQVQRVAAALGSSPIDDQSCQSLLPILTRCATLVAQCSERGVLSTQFWARIDQTSALQECMALDQWLKSEIGAEASFSPGGEDDDAEAGESKEDMEGEGGLDPRELLAQQLLGPLRPVDFDPYALVEAELGMYEKGTRKEVFSAVEAWMQQTDAAEDAAADKIIKNRHRTLWIQGGPGTGKTTIMSALCARYSSSVLGVHYCKHQTARSGWTVMLKSLAFQMAERVPEYRELLLGELNERAAKGASGTSLAAMSALELFQALFTGLLIQIPERPVMLSADGEEEAGEVAPGSSMSPSSRSGATSSNKLLLLIDALDESDSATNPELLSLLRDAWQWPSWVGMLISSRPLREAAEASARWSSGSSSSATSSAPLDYTLVELAYDSKETESDMQLFVSRRLAQLMPHASDVQRFEATRVICERSRGFFLFSRLVLQEYEEQMSKYRYEVVRRAELERQALLKEKMTEGQSEGEGEGGASDKAQEPLLPPALDAQSLAKLALGLDDYFRRCLQRIADTLTVKPTASEAAASSSSLPPVAAASMQPSASMSSDGEGMRRVSLVRQNSVTAPVTLAEIMRLLRVVLAAQEPLSVGIVATLLGQSVARIFLCLEPLRALFPVVGTDHRAKITAVHKSASDWLSSKDRLLHENEAQFFCDTKLGHLLLATEGYKQLTNKHPHAVSEAEWQAKIARMSVDDLINPPEAPTLMLVDETATAAPDSLLAYASRFQAVHAVHAGHLPLVLACLTHLSFIEIRLRGQQAVAVGTEAASEDDVSGSRRNAAALLRDYVLALSTIQAELTRGGVPESAVAGASGEEDALPEPSNLAAFEQSNFRANGESAKSVYSSLVAASSLLRAFYRFVRLEANQLAGNAVLIWPSAFSLPSSSPVWAQAAQLRNWWSARCEWCEWLNKPDSDPQDPCLLVLQGHTEAVDCVLYVRDMIISAGEDRTIRVWDSLSGEIRAVLNPAHTGVVASLAYREDLDLLYSGSSDHTVKVWSLTTFQCIGEVSMPGATIHISFSPCYKRVCLTMAQKGARVMHLRPNGTIDGSLYIAAMNLNEWTSRVMFQNDSTLVIVTERSLELDSITTIPVLRLDPTSMPELDADGEEVVWTETDYTVDGRIVQYAANVCQHERGLHLSIITSLDSVVARGRTFWITGSGDAVSYLYVWSPQNGLPYLERVSRLLYDMDAHQSSSICAIKFAPYGIRDHAFHALHPEIAETDALPPVALGEHRNLPADAILIWCRLAACFSDNSVRIFELKLTPGAIAFQCLDNGLFLGHSYATSAVAWNADASQVVSSSHDKKICVWDTNLNAVKSVSIGPRFGGHHDGVSALTITPDGRRIVSGGMDATLRVWKPDNVHNAEERVIRHLHVSGIDCIAISSFYPIGASFAVATGGVDRIVRVCRVSDGKLLDSAVSHHSGEICALSISRNGTYLATASKDGTCRIWSPAMGCVVNALTRDPVVTTAVAWLPFPSEDVQLPGLCITGTGEGKIQMWQVGAWGGQFEQGAEESIDNMRLLLEQEIHTEGIISIHVCPRYSTFATTDIAGQSRVWQWEWQEMFINPEDLQNPPENDAPQQNRFKKDMSGCLKYLGNVYSGMPVANNLSRLTHDSSYMCYADEPNYRMLVYLVNGHATQSMCKLKGICTAIAPSPTSMRVYVGDSSGSIQLHCLSDPPSAEGEGDGLSVFESIWTHSPPILRRIMSLAVDETETVLVAGEVEGMIRIFKILDAEAPAGLAGALDAESAARARGGLQQLREIQTAFYPINALVLSPDVDPKALRAWVCGMPRAESNLSEHLVIEISVETGAYKTLQGDFEATTAIAFQGYKHRNVPRDYTRAKALKTKQEAETVRMAPVASLLFQSEVSMHRWSLFNTVGRAPVQRLGCSAWRLQNIAYPANSTIPLVASSNIGGEVLFTALHTPPLLKPAQEKKAEKPEAAASAGVVDASASSSASSSSSIVMPVPKANVFSTRFANSVAETPATLMTFEPSGDFRRFASAVERVQSQGHDDGNVIELKDRIQMRSLVGWSPDQKLLAIAKRKQDGYALTLFNVDLGEPSKWETTLSRLRLLNEARAELESKMESNESKLNPDEHMAQIDEAVKLLEADPKWTPLPDERSPKLLPCPFATRVAKMHSCFTSLQFSQSSQYLTIGTEVNGVRLMRVKAEAPDSSDVRLEDLISIDPHMGAITSAHFNDIRVPGKAPGPLFPYLVCAGTDSALRLFDLRHVLEAAAQEQKQAEEAAAADSSAPPSAAPAGLARSVSLKRAPSTTGGGAKATGVLPSRYKFDFARSRTQQRGLCHVLCHVRGEPSLPPPVMVPTVLQLHRDPAAVEESLRSILSQFSRPYLSSELSLNSHSSQYLLRVLRGGGLERSLLLVKASLKLPVSPQIDRIVYLASLLCRHADEVQTQQLYTAGERSDAAGAEVFARRFFSMLVPLLTRYADQPLLLRPIYFLAEGLCSAWARVTEKQAKPDLTVATELVKLMTGQLKTFVSADGELPTPPAAEPSLNNSVPVRTPQEERTELLRILSKSVVHLSQHHQPLLTTFLQAHGPQLLVQLVQDDGSSDVIRSHYLDLIQMLMGVWFANRELMRIFRPVDLRGLSYELFDRSTVEITRAAASASSAAHPLSRSLLLVSGRAIRALIVFYKSAEAVPVDGVLLLRRLLQLWRTMLSVSISTGSDREFDPTGWVPSCMLLQRILVMQQDDLTAALHRMAAPVAEAEGAAVPVTDDELFACFIGEGCCSLLLESMERWVEPEIDGSFTMDGIAFQFMENLAARQHRLRYELLGGSFDTWHRLLQILLTKRQGDSAHSEREGQMIRLFSKLFYSFEIAKWYELHDRKIEQLLAEHGPQQAEGAERQAQMMPAQAHRARLQATLAALKNQGSAAELAAGEQVRRELAAAPDSAESAPDFADKMLRGIADPSEATKAFLDEAIRAQESSNIVEMALAFDQCKQNLKIHHNLLPSAALLENHPMADPRLVEPHVIDYLIAALPPSNFLTPAMMEKADRIAECFLMLLHTLKRIEDAQQPASSSSSSSSSSAASPYNQLVARLRAHRCPHLLSPEAGADPVAVRASTSGASMLVLYLLRTFTHPYTRGGQQEFTVLLLSHLFRPAEDKQGLTETDEAERLTIRFRRGMWNARKNLTLPGYAAFYLALETLLNGLGIDPVDADDRFSALARHRLSYSPSNARQLEDEVAVLLAQFNASQQAPISNDAQDGVRWEEREAQWLELED